MFNLLRFSSSFNCTKSRIVQISHKPLTQAVRKVFSPQTCRKTIETTLQQRSTFCTRAYDVNTQLTKDVILFKYENPNFFKYLNIFGISQFMFWTYLSHFAYTTLRDAPVEEHEDQELAWYEKINLGENKYRNGITVMSFLIGYGILAAVWMYTLRSVRFLILRKGGRDVTVVTYGPFGKNSMMTVPVKSISAQTHRDVSEVLLPLKIRNRSLFYVLDMKGEFKNPQLYDYTAGLNRRF